MGGCFSQNSVEENGPSQPVNFKVEPDLIPKGEVIKLEKFPNGTGGLGDVWLCSWNKKSGTCRVAVKSVRVPHSDDTRVIKKAGERIRREAYVWIGLKHDNVLKFFGIIEGFGPLPALVSPWMENGSLESYLKKEGVALSKVKILHMLGQIAAGLKYLHDKEIAHGDLTCTNILISDDGRLYLADFGLSMILAESQNATFNSCHSGNVRWMAPEMLAMPEEGEEEMIKPTKAADIYSYGCIMLQLFSGQLPYAWLTQAMHVISARVKGTEPFRANQITAVEDRHRKYSLRCLSSNSAARPDISGIVRFLEGQ